MPPDPQTEAYRAATAQISAAAALLAAQAFQRLVDPARALVTFNLWLDRITPPIAAATLRTADIAEVDFMRTRTAAGVTSRFVWEPQPLNVEQFRSSMFATAGQALQDIERIRQARPFDDPRDPAGVQVKKAEIAAQGAVVRHTMNGARNSTIVNAQRDQRSLGALYVTRDDDKVCYWCAMLASRGPVYKTDSFLDADPQFKASMDGITDMGPGTTSARSHDFCRCVLKTVYSAGTPLLEASRALEAQWKAVNYDERGRVKNSGKDALLAWRRHWEGRSEPISI